MNLNIEKSVIRTCYKTQLVLVLYRMIHMIGFAHGSASIKNFKVEIKSGSIIVSFKDIYNHIISDEKIEYNMIIKKTMIPKHMRSNISDLDKSKTGKSSIASSAFNIFKRFKRYKQTENNDSNLKKEEYFSTCQWETILSLVINPVSPIFLCWGRYEYSIDMEELGETYTNYYYVFFITKNISKHTHNGHTGKSLFNTYPLYIKKDENKNNEAFFTVLLDQPGPYNNALIVPEDELQEDTTTAIDFGI